MSGTLKTRLQRLEVPMEAAARLRWAEWLETMPVEERPAVILQIEYDGDVDALKRREATFRNMSDAEIAEFIQDMSGKYIQHLRDQAKELRGKRI